MMRRLCKKDAAFSLLEVLVAIVILAIGLLGIAGIQLTGLRYSHNSNLIYQAALQASDIADRMSANLEGVSRGVYNNFSGIGSYPSCIEINCNAAQIAAADLYEWNMKNATVLPQGMGIVTAGADATFTVVISWKERGSTATQNQFKDKSFTMTFRP